jgi:hypothetical protein
MRSWWLAGGLAGALLPQCGGRAVIDGEGGGPPDCGAIERDYQEALARAKRCDPAGGAAVCDEAVSAALTPCEACLTWASSANQEALDDMDVVINEYVRTGCASVMVDCGGRGCTDAPGAACGASGVCEDMR